MATVKDIDGAREVHFEVRNSSVFLWNDRFCYEFDTGLVVHQLTKEFGALLAA